MKNFKPSPCKNAKKRKKTKITENIYEISYTLNLRISSKFLEDLKHQGQFEIIEFCAKTRLLKNEAFCKV